MNYVYERDYAVLVRLKVPADARGTVPIRADAHWLACTDKICVPEQGELSLDLPVGSRNAESRAVRCLAAGASAAARDRSAHFAVAGDKLRVAIPLPASVAVGEPYLFPITDGPVDYEAQAGFRRSGDYADRRAQRKGADPKQFAGVIALGDGRGLEFRAVPGAGARGTPLGGLGWTAVLWAVLGAIAGGILLNLMPCVFPILALKALHMSRAGGEAREARSDALAYTAGAIVGTGALGAVLLAIRAAGAQAGWAFQLQDPRTIMLLLLLAVAITANLLGLFELPVLGGTRAAGRKLRHRRARRIRRDALRRPVPRRRARHGAAAAARGIGAGVRRARLGPRAAVRAGRLRSGAADAAAQARARGCSASSASSRFRWRRARSRRCGCCTGRPGERG